MLIHAVEAEVAQWIDDRQHLLDADGHRQVVRNGHAAPRTIVTGVGAMRVRMPRVSDRRELREPELWTTWLASDTPPKTLQDMLTPAPDGILALHPVDKRVNRAGPDDAALIQATDSQASEGSVFENNP